MMYFILNIYLYNIGVLIRGRFTSKLTEGGRLLNTKGFQRLACIPLKLILSRQCLYL